MSDSDGDSPGWLRDFQAPNHGLYTLSSDSNSSSDSKKKYKRGIVNGDGDKRRKKLDYSLIDSSEDSPDKISKKRPREVEKKLDVNEETHKGETAEQELKEERHNGPPLSSRLPLVLPEKVQRSKALIECDGDTIDLSGDVGAVGRIIISNDSNGNEELLLDLKGTIYKTTIIPSRTFCVVSIGQTEAKIESIMNDFIQLEPQSNLFEAETMIEGTLDGFSFDSDAEGEKMPKPPAQGDGNNENGDEAGTKKGRKKERPPPQGGKKGSKKAKTAGKLSKKKAARNVGNTKKSKK